jgi:hypothetical protein
VIAVPINLDDKLDLVDVEKLKEDKFKYLEKDTEKITTKSLNTDLPYVE